MKKTIAKLLILSMAISASSSWTLNNSEAAKKSTKLSAKTLAITEGKSKNVTVKNATKSVSWSIKTGKKNVKIKKLNKKTLRVTAVKKGKAKLQCKVGAKKLICDVIVKGKKVVPSAPVVSAEPTVSAEAPAVSAEPTVSAEATAVSTVAPTNTPRPTHIPTEDCLMKEPAIHTMLPSYAVATNTPAPAGESEVPALASEIPSEPNIGREWCKFFGTDILRKDIEELRFSDTINPPENPIGLFDVSEKQNKSVMAWITDEDQDGSYEATIAQEGGVIANEDSSYLCCYLSNVVGFEHLYTEGVRDMSCMFAYFDYYCRHHEKNSMLLDFGDYFDTSNVEDMSFMFGMEAFHQSPRNIDFRFGKKFVIRENANCAAMFAGMGSGKIFVNSEVTYNRLCEEGMLRFLVKE